MPQAIMTFRSILFALFIVVATPTSASADQTDVAAARQLATSGIEAYQRGDYEAAIDLLKRAEAVLHAPTHLLYMARAYRDLKQPVDAYELYNQVIRERLKDDAPPAFLEAQRAAREQIDGLKEQFAFMTVELKGKKADEVTVKLDDSVVASALIGVKIPVNPGAHVLVAEDETGVLAQAKFSINEAKHAPIELRILAQAKSAGAPLADERSVPVLPYIALGLGGAGLIAGGVFTGIHFAQKSKAASLFDDADCEVSCYKSERDEVDRHDRKAATAGSVAWIGFGVGAAGLATGVTLLLLRSNSHSNIEDASIRPVFGLGYLGAAGNF